MIIIAPYAAIPPGRGVNAKNYPHWKQLIPLIDEPIVQVGVSGEEQLVDDVRHDLSLPELTNLVNQCRTWISVDSFFQHWCWSLGKRGIVIFAQSDPNIFGHPENINILKSRSYLREKQFWLWSQTNYNPEAYPDPSIVVQELINIK